jgi:DNA-binding response OmpR family regulator
LESACYAVDATDNAERGFYLARLNEYDLMILDYVLPEQSGLDLCRGLRAEGINVPILILSVKSSIPDKVLLLEQGADDYLTKPFSVQELLARVRALTRRPAHIQSPVMTIGDITIDSTRQVVTCRSRDVYLTRKEFTLLEYLARQRGTVVTRSMIMEHVWNMERDLFSNTIEAHILNLRKKLARGTKRKYIYTVPGRGYKLDPAET